ncbi:MAG: hypothetical protein RDU24_12870 [Humidesulfovibrio sp.]|uniref:hypothetical protein n=1 Tax=Humidesulfovibrio sp. TaxID=2910988 RepID=UPI0027FF1FBD|nr:hypothetical protein [Humidesulfovibrio sp.]MDQ7836267.1 hypothetical protein [Humidesulfovibrio sp.]
MRGRQPGHYIAVRRRPCAVVVHAVREPERPVVKQRSGGIHFEVRGGALIERSHDCVALRQFASVGDAARLKPHIVAHGGPKHAPISVAAANKPHRAVNLDDKPPRLHGPAGRAGAA